jgi:hypothetical protein
MRPREFVSRIIDLYEFQLGGSSGWANVRPKNYSAAALAIQMADTPNPLRHHHKTVNGYKFTLESEMALGHTVIRATMSQDDISVSGSICFTFQDCDSLPPEDNVSLHDHIFESWQVPPHLKNTVDLVVEMLTFLTLKTSYNIKQKNSPN